MLTKAQQVVVIFIVYYLFESSIAGESESVSLFDFTLNLLSLTELNIFRRPKV